MLPPNSEMYENPTHVDFLFQTEEVLQVIFLKLKKVSLGWNSANYSVWQIKEMVEQVQLYLLEWISSVAKNTSQAQ